MKRKIDSWLVGICLVTGFIAGVLYIELSSGAYCKSLQTFSRDQLLHFAEKDIDPTRLLEGILPVRLIWLFLLWLGMCTPFRKMVYAICCIWFGFASGIEVTTLLFQVKMAGPLIYLASILPQGLCYVIGMSLFYDMIKAKGETYTSLLLKSILAFVIMIGGIITECYLGAGFLKWTIKMLLVK